MAGPEVSIEELSRFIDGQLSAEEAATMEQRLASCAVSRRLLEGMREVHAELAAAFLEQPPQEDTPAQPGCLDGDTLMLLAEGKLSAAGLKAAEAHAVGCPRCLRALLLEMRSHTSMKAAHWRDLPPEVTGHPWLRGIPMNGGKTGGKKPGVGRTDAEDVSGREASPVNGEGGSSRKGGQPSSDREGRIPGVGGLERLEQAAQAEEKELIVVGEVRHEIGSRGQTQRSFAAGDFVMIVILRSADSQSVNLEIQVLKQRKPLWEAEVGVAEQGTDRKIFRGLSSRDGRVLIRKLKAGGYDIIVPVAALRVTLAVVT